MWWWLLRYSIDKERERERRRLVVESLGRSPQNSLYHHHHRSRCSSSLSCSLPCVQEKESTFPRNIVDGFGPLVWDVYEAFKLVLLSPARQKANLSPLLFTSICFHVNRPKKEKNSRKGQWQQEREHNWQMGAAAAAVAVFGTRMDGWRWGDSRVQILRFITNLWKGGSRHPIYE